MSPIIWPEMFYVRGLMAVNNGLIQVARAMIAVGWPRGVNWIEPVHARVDAHINAVVSKLRF